MKRLCTAVSLTSTAPMAAVELSCSNWHRVLHPAKDRRLQQIRSFELAYPPDGSRFFGQHTGSLIKDRASGNPTFTTHTWQERLEA
ncbi:MAG TPA: hypothetical protein VF026_04160 [Ktedonobacteraceae bacterium]